MEEILEKYPINNVAFTGGEPTVRRDFNDSVKGVRKIRGGGIPNFSVTTNGFALQTPHAVKEMIESGVNRFSVSYHGIGYHDEFTGVNGAEERVRNAIDNLLEQRKNYSDINIKVGCLHSGNIENIVSMLEYSRKGELCYMLNFLRKRLGYLKNLNY